MNPVTAARAVVAGVRLGQSIATHRRQMKKLKEERKFWIDLRDTVNAQQKPTVIHVQCERLA